MLRRFRRRTVPAGQPAIPSASPGEAGHALRAPSRLHAFNRYEIKYLVDAAVAGELRKEMDGLLDRDRHSGENSYGIWSVYYDTRRLRFYWEKIEGLKFRRKLRIHH